MSETGRRLVLVGSDRVELEPFDVPEPGAGQLLVRVHRSQISAGSEKNAMVAATSADARRSSGHTMAGRVQAVGSGVVEFKSGDKVLAFGNHASHWLAGQLVTAVCRLSGAYPIVAVDLDAARLRLSDISGATHTINASEEDAVEAVRELTDGGARCVFHATRDPEVLVPCMEAAGQRAKVILVGSPPGTVEIGLQVELLRRELDIRGTYEQGLENNPHPY